LEQGKDRDELRKKISGEEEEKERIQRRF